MGALRVPLLLPPAPAMTTSTSARLERLAEWAETGNRAPAGWLERAGPALPVPKPEESGSVTGRPSLSSLTTTEADIPRGREGELP